ncbi:MAG TPA: carbon-nitrogen hydrolase family protein [Euzebyales bacterium]|nr:carbon-nitrogen hydrolase family protein [Euzebyales bacterium]
MSVTVAALQVAAAVGAVEANLRRLAALVAGIEADLDLVVAPEMVNTGYDLERADELLSVAEPFDGPTVGLASDLSARRDATVVLGLLERGSDERVYDTVVLAQPDGTLDRYRKSHLYPPEATWFTAGDETVTVASPAGHLGVLICFEHAFPELATTLALQGAEILVIPSAVPTGYEYLLRLRTRARAQDNQIFAVAANLTGGTFAGRSLIADPRGEVVAEAGTDEQALIATLDLDAIAAERSREPALRMRRPELYR